MSSLSQRYCDGQREEVWAQLYSLGDLVNDERYLEDATAVAAETMKRARHNVETIIDRLNAIGYKFQAPRKADSLQPDIRHTGKFGSFQVDWLAHSPPSAEVDAQIFRLEEAAGLLPLSLASWYQEVGSVDLEGSHPKLCGFADSFVAQRGGQETVSSYPMLVLPLAHGLWACNDFAAEDQCGPFLFPIARYGEDAEGIELPDSRADAVFTLTGQRFVDYLRLCFRWGGFPRWPSHDQRPDGELAHLAADLLPI